jgi:membrane-associated protease RseP (regulator of RpoE activity)
MPSPLFRPGDRPLLNLGLLLATGLSTFGTFFVGPFGGEPGATLANQLWAAAEFSACLLLILGAHEMGHYLLARRHGVDTSLPYFIPLPIIGVGTLGAVIRIRGPIPSKNALVDIGAAGPLAGLLVAVPVLVWGLAHSRVADAPPLGHGFPGENSLWVLVPELVRYLTTKAAPQADVVHTMGYTVFGDNLLMLGLQRLVIGPLPAGKEVFVHPTVVAGWFGMLVTMLNLIPVGQLDGGHLTHALLGDRARLLGKVMAAAMVGLCLFYTTGWLLWLVLTTTVIGFKHPPVVQPQEPLSPLRKVVCLLCLVAFIICVMPVPLSQVAAP